MSFTIDREAVDQFVHTVLDSIEEAKIPRELVAHSPFSFDDTHCNWLCSNIATKLGMAIIQYPYMFVRAYSDENR